MIVDGPTDNGSGRASGAGQIQPPGVVVVVAQITLRRDLGKEAQAFGVTDDGVRQHEVNRAKGRKFVGRRENNFVIGGVVTVQPLGRAEVSTVQSGGNWV